MDRGQVLPAHAGMIPVHLLQWGPRTKSWTEKVMGVNSDLNPTGTITRAEVVAMSVRVQPDGKLSEACTLAHSWVVSEDRGYECSACGEAQDVDVDETEGDTTEDGTTVDTETGDTKTNTGSGEEGTDAGVTASDSKDFSSGTFTITERVYETEDGGTTGRYYNGYDEVIGAMPYVDVYDAADNKLSGRNEGDEGDCWVASMSFEADKDAE